jgi:hypothetical protein
LRLAFNPVLGATFCSEKGKTSVISRFTGSLTLRAEDAPVLKKIVGPWTRWQAERQGIVIEYAKVPAESNISPLSADSLILRTRLQSLSDYEIPSKREGLMSLDQALHGRLTRRNVEAVRAIPLWELGKAADPTAATETDPENSLPFQPILNLFV